MPHMPDWKQAIRSRLTNVPLAVVDELAQHLEDRYEALRSGGAEEQEAYLAVLDELGDGEVLLSEFQNVAVEKDTRPPRYLADLRQDIRYSFRTLRRQPGFALVATLTLALGIGANTAIFSVVNGVLLRPLGFDEPERLFMIWTNNPAYQVGFNEFPAANSDLPEWRATAKSFQEIAAYGTTPADLSEDGDPERVGAVEITANLMSTLGVAPLIGRTFSAQEEQPGQDTVAIISYDLWQQRYGGAKEILDRTITVNQLRRQIIAVMPQGFNSPRATEMPQAYNLPEKADLWIPLARGGDYWQRRTQRGLVCLVGRLKRDVTATQAQAEMDQIAARQAIAYPDTHKGWRVWLTPFFNQVIGRTRMPLLILLGAVGVLLLIACANITSLLLAKGAGRRREIAVRAAIGAGRARIIRQLLTESILLGLLGGGFGLLLGYWGLHVLLTFIPANVPRIQNVTLDSKVFIFTAIISLLTGVLFGLAPAFQASKLNLIEALKSSAQMHSAGTRIRAHRLLVCVQVALVAVLLVGAVLMLKSFRRLMAVDPGFRPQGVATFQLSLPWTRYSDVQQREKFYEQTRLRLQSLPGVHAVGAISRAPLTGNESMNYMAIEGAEPVPRGQEPLAEDRVITSGYFNAMGVSLVSGRDFDERDGHNQPLVAIVNETLARKFFPNGNAVGGRIKWALDDKEWRTIVGVVRDVRGHALEVEPRPQFYHPFAESPDEDSMSFVVRTDALTVPSLHSAIKQELKQLDPSIPAANFRSMPELVTRAVARPRFSTLLLGLFAALALLLAFVGLYGVVAHGVTQRTREIGIRMAVGAQRRDVLALIIRQGMQPALAGLVLGLFAAFALARVLASQLYEVSPRDPATFIVVGVGLFLVALCACFIPARRATRIDPVTTLRFE